MIGASIIVSAPAAGDQRSETDDSDEQSSYRDREREEIEQKGGRHYPNHHQKGQDESQQEHDRCYSDELIGEAHVHLYSQQETV